MLNASVPISRGQKERFEVTMDMICEQHPWLEWPHDDCSGPGCPPAAAASILLFRMRQLELKLRVREATIVELFYALKKKTRVTS